MGLLTFHPYPQQYYPKLRITFTSHPASDSSPKDQAVRYLDNKVFEGPIEEVISDAIKYLIQQLPERLAVTTLRNRKQPEIPEIVLRELILNAVVHRDYSPMVQNREIRIRLFPDRVVIHNPGGLFGGIRIETIKTHNSVSRNPHFATLLEDIGLIENRGDGIATVLAECQDAGLREPHFVDLIDSFEVTVFRGSSTIQSDTQYEQITCKDLESFLIKHKEFCRSDLIAALDLTPGQAKYEILKLKRDNRIKQFGAGRGAKYRVLEKALPEGSKIL
jgi:predicted HTH transcriptional regulator